MENQDCSTGRVTKVSRTKWEARQPHSSSHSRLPSFAEPSTNPYIHKKSFPPLIAPVAIGIVSSLQHKIAVGIRETEHFISANTRTKGVFFCAIPSMVARAGHPRGGRVLMRPVTLNLLELPPLRLESQPVVPSSHQRLPA